MSIIAEVKCARCDRKYSGVRSRCPYCGARRIGSGKYSEGGDNTRGKMLIGVLIMGVLVVAAGVLLFTTRPEDADIISSPPVIETEPEDSPTIPGEEGNTSVEGPSFIVIETPEPDEIEETPTPTPQPVPIESVTITYAGYPIAEFTEPVGREIQLVAKVEPAGVEFDEKITWESSNTAVFEVVELNLQGTTAKVTIIGASSYMSGTLTVSVGDVEATCIVRVRG